MLKKISKIEDDFEKESKTSKEKILLNKIAELTHREWISWSKELVKSEKLSKEKVDLWKKLWIDYSKLPVKEKKKDLIWAKKFLDLMDDRKEKIGYKKTKYISKSHYTKLEKSKGSIRSGFGFGIIEATKLKRNIVALCADLTDSLKLTDFKKKYPNKFFQMGICEQNMASAAAGMTINNKIPFIVSYAAFNPMRNLDQIRTSICYSNNNVKIVGGHAGLTTGPDGATHQALEDISVMRTLPNMTVVVPCDENQAREATIEISKIETPAYLRLSREKSLNITDKKFKFKLGEAQIFDQGDDITIIACGVTLQFALEAREKLKEQNISATVINIHTIKPLDTKTILKFAKKTNAILTVEEHQITGGLGSAVCEVLSQNYPCLVDIIGVKDIFGESGSGYKLLEKYGISTKEIVKRSKALILKKK